MQVRLVLYDWVTHSGIHVVREITYCMPATIHCYINKNLVGQYIYIYIHIYMINVNVIYIFILAIRIYNINPLVGICKGCEYAYIFSNNSYSQN